MLGKADTIGVFQIESRAQMAMLPRLRPTCFYDLVIEVAIVRPGPIQGGMVHPYLRRRAGLEPVVYPSEAVRSVLEKTLGVPIFQEQAMRIAVVAAGFTPGEADQLRRAMGAWRRAGIIESFEKRLVDGMLARGYAEEFARAVFRQIHGFGEYGFPESHAASFALLAYVSSWLKRYDPACFTAALLNSQPMGFYAPAQLVRDAREHGVEVRPVDVTASDVRLHARRRTAGAGAPCRLGLPHGEGPLPGRGRGRIVGGAGSGRSSPSRTAAAARGSPRRDAKLLADVRRVRAALPRTAAHAWWDAALDQGPAPLLADEPVVEAAAGARRAHRSPRSSSRTTGPVALAARPPALAPPRRALAQRGCRPAAELKAGAPRRGRCRIAGLVINRQRPATASGIIFMTLEDETGFANLIVRVKEQERFRARSSAAVFFPSAAGSSGPTTSCHVLVLEAHDLSGADPARSRPRRAISIERHGGRGGHGRRRTSTEEHGVAEREMAKCAP